MLCTYCGIEIPVARLEAIPETTTCVEHSSVQPYKAIISGTTKNKQFDVQVVKADDPSLDYHEENRWGKVSEADD
jgi:hypothetical protein